MISLQDHKIYFDWFFDWFWLVLINLDWFRFILSILRITKLPFSHNSLIRPKPNLVFSMEYGLCSQFLKCYKWNHFAVLPVQCRAGLSMAVTAASNARSRAWGAKKKGWKVQILLAIIDLLIYILKVLCSYLQHLLLFRSPVVQETRV